MTARVAGIGRIVRIRWVVAVIIAATAGAAACWDMGSNPPDVTPGPVTYRLVSPNGAEGAVLFSAPANQVLDARPTEPLTGSFTEERDGLLYVAITSLHGGDLRFRLDLVDKAAPPTLTVIQVVSPSNVRRDLDGYRLEVVQ